MTVKPVARPRPEPAPVPPRPRFPTVAVKISNRNGIFFYGATNGELSWSGAASAPTREAALLDVCAEVRAAVDGPLRFAVSVPPTSPIWRHTVDLQTALNCVVERADLRDQPLMEVVVEMLAALAPPDPDEPATRPAEQLELKEQLTVATDGSVRGRFIGHSWLAGNGRYRLHGVTKVKGLHKREAVLLAELSAIDDAVRSLRRHPLIVLTDSTAAKTLVEAWMDGRDAHPSGFRGPAGDQLPLAQMREVIHDSRDRLEFRWVRGHSGDPLNEGADALARLASRYVRGDSGLTVEEYAQRGKGLAVSFAEEFGRRS